MEIKEALWWVHNTAADMAERGLMFHQFNHPESDKRNLISEKAYIDVATYLYSVIWKINADIVRMAIMEIGKTYSKGNLYGAMELDRDIKKLVENKVGRKLEVAGTDDTVKNIINWLFLMASDKYRKHMNGDTYAFAECLVREEALHRLVLHVWKMEKRENEDGPVVESFVDTRMSIEETVKEIAEKEIPLECAREAYIKHYIKRYEKRVNRKRYENRQKSI